MMIPDRNQLDRMMECDEPYCVTLMMPTHPSGDQWQEDRIRFKNLMQQVRDELGALGVRNHDIDPRLAPFQVLVNDKTFWKEQAEGLALVIGCNSTELFSVPVELDELVVVGSHFHLKPLMPLLANDLGFNILALSKKKVRLFKASRYDVREIQSDKFPDDFESAMAEVDPERQLQFHSGTQQRPHGKRPAVFHGQGGDQDLHDRSKEYCRRVYKGISSVVGNGDTPMVLAATEPLQSRYRQVIDDPDTIAATVDKNPDDLTAAQLHAAAVCRIAGRFRQDARKARDDYLSLVSGGRAVDDPAEVFKAASTGRAAIVLASAEDHLWGRTAEDGMAFDGHDERLPGDEDMLNVALIRGKRNGAQCWVLPRHDMPNEKMLTAVLHG